MTTANLDPINQFRSSLEGTKSILIANRANPSLDQVAAGLSLYLALSAIGKQATLVCPTPMTVEFSHLIGVDNIGTSITGTSGKNLVISFPYQEGSIEKVSYNIENNIFNLVIEPREGFPVITSDMIRYAQSGGNTDLIITIGIAKLTDLDNLYSSNQSFFTEKLLINIDNQSQNTRFGRVNIVDQNSASVSELVTTLFSRLGFNLDSDIATNLLSGITTGCQNFTSNLTSVTTFESAAICLRNGARTIGVQQRTPLPKITTPYKPQPTPLNPFTTPFTGSKPLPKKTFVSQLPVTPSSRESTHPETPPDWLKPKIYKGSTLL